MALGSGPRRNIGGIGAKLPKRQICRLAGRLIQAVSGSGIRSSIGSVITEAVVVIPVLLASIVGMLSIGFRLSDYMYLSQSARDIGLVLSRMPHMYEIRTYTFDADPKAAAATLRSTVESCISERLNSNYVGCTASDCPCVKSIAQWYVNEQLKGKKLSVSWPVQVSISYQRRDASDSTSGLCFIRVQLQAAANDALPSFGALGGSVSAKAFVPYVGDPVHFNGGACG